MNRSNQAASNSKNGNSLVLCYADSLLVNNFVLVRKYIIFLMVAISPLIANAQRPTIETCGLKLYEEHTRIYANDTLRKQGLSLMFNPSDIEMRKAWNEWSDCVRGKMIPSLNFVTINGKKYNDSNLRGKVLVINFWFKGCAPCVSEMPSLNKLRNEFKDKDVVFIGFATDAEKDLRPMYLNSEKFLFDIVANSQNIAKKFVFNGFPTTYIVDQNGKIVKAWTGNTIDMAQPYEISRPIINQLLSH